MALQEFQDGEWLYRLHVDRLDTDFADAAAFHLHDGEAPSFVVHAFALFRNMSETGKNKARESLDSAFSRQAPLHLGFKVAKVRAAIQQ